jgi:hypothetical protein
LRSIRHMIFSTPSLLETTLMPEASPALYHVSPSALLCTKVTFTRTRYTACGCFSPLPSCVRKTLHQNCFTAHNTILLYSLCPKTQYNPKKKGPNIHTCCSSSSELSLPKTWRHTENDVPPLLSPRASTQKTSTTGSCLLRYFRN